MINVDVKPGKYVVAVSGGVDSIALLHLLKPQPKLQLLVAHVNHGIRNDTDTAKDEELISALCVKWNIDYVSKRLNLGENASEDVARRKRHEFLREVLKSNNYNKIITAHHKDDVIETMIINLLRGTGRKGLSSIKSDETYLRPLIEYTKEEVVAYAHKHKLSWNEDVTNLDQNILRNYVRLTLIPTMKKSNPEVTSFYYDLYKQMLDINRDIDIELDNLERVLRVEADTYARSKLIMLPIEVSYVFLHYLLDQKYKVDVNAEMLKRLRTFIHTSKSGKRLNLVKQLDVVCVGSKIEYVTKA